MSGTGVQHRTTFLLLTNHGINAATGILFWLLFIRVVGLDAGGIGIGYTVVAIGTAVGLIAKGGLGTALMRHVPTADAGAGRRLLQLSIMAGLGMTALLMAATFAFVFPTTWLHQMSPWDWLFATAIAGLLVVAWMQDAYFLARGRPGATVVRNSVFSAAKLAAPLLILLLAVPSVAGAWALALAAAAAVGFLMSRGPIGIEPDRALFFRSAWRNVLGNAAEFLPGLLLVPLVLMLSGADAAGYFSMAWTIASMLFLAVTAIGRSALTQMVRGEPAGSVVSRALMQGAFLIVPGAVLGVVLAEPVLRVFGADYAAVAGPALVVLASSALLVLPVYLYLDVLRARESAKALNAFPLAIIVLLFVLAPVLTAQYGVTGTALAWLLANLPFSLWTSWRLHQVMGEVDVHGTATHGGHPHAE